jgi:hypothetical protein
MIVGSAIGGALYVQSAVHSTFHLTVDKSVFTRADFSHHVNDAGRGLIESR